MQHRSTASSSEPSLIPADSELQTRTRRNSVRLASNGTQLGSSTVQLSSGSNSKEAVDTADDDDPEMAGKEFADRCWQEDEDFLPKEKIAEWLGGQ
jgi:hypothetical protein